MAAVTVKNSTQDNVSDWGKSFGEAVLDRAYDRNPDLYDEAFDSAKGKRVKMLEAIKSQNPRSFTRWFNEVQADELLKRKPA